MTTITDEAPTFGRQGALEWLSIDVVIPSDMNPRKDFSAAALATLRDSMTRYGQLQPSIVQPYKPNANTVLYRLVEGERRYHTAKKIGMKEIPCLVVHRSLSDHDELELMFQIHGKARDGHRSRRHGRSSGSRRPTASSPTPKSRAACT
jgi:ParB/RepB/Spo0J family partition protein